MKYKIYKVTDTNSQPQCSCDLLIIQSEPLTPLAQTSLNKLIKACRIEDDQVDIFINNTKEQIVNVSKLFSDTKPHFIWFFGIGPQLTQLPPATPVNRSLAIWNKYCMFWPSYNTIAESDTLKRALWQEIKIMLEQNASV